MNCKKIGLDFHGVINTDPVFFKQLALSIQEKNMEVHIISGGPENSIRQYLQNYAIPYNKIWCIFDYYERKDMVTIHSDGSFYMDDELWNKAKAEYCRQNNICVQIDDSLIYGNYFSTPYCLYNAKQKKGKLNNHKIDFAASPHIVLDRLLQGL